MSRAKKLSVSATTRLFVSCIDRPVHSPGVIVGVVLDLRCSIRTSAAGSSVSAVVRHAISPRTATTPKRKSARLAATRSDE
jgi:hypothetical protein